MVVNGQYLDLYQKLVEEEWCNFCLLLINQYQLYTMKQSLKHSKDKYQSFLSQCKSLIAKNSNQKPQKNIENNVILPKIIDFNLKEYPFSNTIDLSVKLYRTSLLCSSTSQRIQHLIDIKHANIINIQKIVKSQRKSLMNKEEDVTYNIFYQKIPYSVKYIGFGDETSHKLLTKMGEINFRQILNNLLLYFIKMKINYAIKLIDIGVTESGIIKIYLPPTVVVTQNKKQIDRHLLIQNNQKLISWWETTFNSLDSPEKTQYQGREHKIKTNPSISSTEQKVNFRLGSCQTGAKKRLSLFRPLEQNKTTLVRSITNLNSSTKSYGSELSMVTAFQMQKMKKIDQQIKLIKQKIRQNSKNQKRKDSDHLFIDQYRQNLKNHTSRFNAFQSERLDKKLFHEQNKNNQTKQVGLFGDSIQQNINCINIYNQTPTTYSPNKNKQSSKIIYNQPSASYIVKPPTIKNVKETFSPIQSPLKDIEDENSFDTYDIQLNNEEDATSKVPAYRNTIGLYQRQISQRNHQIRKEKNKLPKQTKNNQKNQVQSRKFAVESAGPLQFKNFINNIVKPQFLAKKSNIYEDPMQEQSEQSAKKIKVIYKQLADAGRSVASQTQKSKSTQKIEQQKQKINKVPQRDKMQRILSANMLPAFQKQSNAKDHYFNIHQMPSEQPSKLQMANRVKQILQRTKNAIQVLNRSKYKSNSNFFRKAVSP